jgi:hypothetical protein
VKEVKEGLISRQKPQCEGVKEGGRKVKEVEQEILYTTTTYILLYPLLSPFTLSRVFGFRAYEGRG